MGKLYDVVIAGAGPVGLQLACELALARASVLVLERNAHPNSPWKSYPLGRRALNIPSMEGFYRRGLLDKVLASPEQSAPARAIPGFKFGGIFAGIMLNANQFEANRFKYRLPGPAFLSPTPTSMEQVEATLARRAEELGVTIQRGVGFTKIKEEHEDSIVVEAGDNQSFQGRWLVGCDGARSAVRSAAHIELQGTRPKFTGYAIHCDLDHPDQLRMGFNRTETGMYAALPESLYLVDFDDGAFDRNSELTHEHLQSVFSRISGLPDVNITKVHLASTFTDRAMQAAHYRKGRVLLVGDAAHFHGPLGGQGLNIGLGDAMNLGWKLGSAVRQEQAAASPRDCQVAVNSLIDTYEKERHPIGAAVLESTRAQVAAMVPGPHGAAIHAVLRNLVSTKDGTNMCIDTLWGLSQRYQLGEEKAHTHPVIGCSAPDFEFVDGSRLGSKLASGQGLFIDFENDGTLQSSLRSEELEQVQFVGMAAKNQLGLRAMLVRPDGIVAWVAESDVEPDVDTAKAALRKWFNN
ncbi:Monoogygenase [Paramyrothecium foliicola]|nr:Monoogygenase [Paramyrothecium foliicola]